MRPLRLGFGDGFATMEDPSDEDDHGIVRFNAMVRDYEMPAADGIEFVEIPWAAAAPYEITDMRFFPGSNELLLLSKPGIFYHYELVGDELVELGSFEVLDTFLFFSETSGRLYRVPVRHPVGLKRYAHTATNLRTGRILIVGGFSPSEGGIPSAAYADVLLD